MKAKVLTTIILAAFLSYGCSYDLESDESGKGVIATGLVTDHEGHPVEHIRISISSENMTQEIVYTSSDGIYRALLDLNLKEDKGIQLNFTAEDIDGAENGGMFDSAEDMVILFKENHPDGMLTIKKDFHLTLSRQ